MAAMRGMSVFMARFAPSCPRQTVLRLHFLPGGEQPRPTLPANRLQTGARQPGFGRVTLADPRDYPIATASANTAASKTVPKLVGAMKRSSFS